MILPHPQATIGVLISGGLDSSILAARLVEQQYRIQPFYICSDLIWQQAELAAVDRFLTALNSPLIEPIVRLDSPLRDLYGDHWSTTGIETPDASTPDEAVFLPGRNALLILKAAIWCQMRGIGALALAPLGANPFADATGRFFANLQAMLADCGKGSVAILRPFSEMTKREVMQIGARYPLEHTFSCISPVGMRHCGQCNKCGERQLAFRSAGLDDPTAYAVAAQL